MKFYASLNILLVYFSLQTVSASSASSTIEDAVGDGCQNIIDFESQFVTDAGDECTTCHFCSGSKLIDIFNPKKESVCIDCSSVDNECNSLQLITRFQQQWAMEFVSIISSNMDSNFDPARVVLKASNDSQTWESLYNSDDHNGLDIVSRKTAQDLLFNPSQKFKEYEMSFKMKDASSKMYLGQYGIVESFTKICTSNLFKDITGDYAAPYKTSAPTNVPSLNPTLSYAPTAELVPCTATMHTQEGPHNKEKVERLVVDDNIYVFAVRGQLCKMVAYDKSGNFIKNCYMGKSEELTIANWNKAECFGGKDYYLTDLTFCLEADV